MGAEVAVVAARRGSRELWELAVAQAGARVGVAAPTPTERDQFAGLGSRVVFGDDAVARLAAEPGIIVINAVVGAAGLKASVAAAERDRGRREVASKIRLDADEEKLAARVNGARSRVVTGRLFVLRNDVWTDAGHRDTQRVIRVAAFSDAYFALLRRLTELEPWWREFDRVLVAGHQVSIEIGPTGEMSLAAARLDEVARGFRAP